MAQSPATLTPEMRTLPKLIFMSRWLQLPLYLGLIAAQGVYVWHFLLELWHLIEAAFGSQAAIGMLAKSIGYTGEAVALNETIIMLVVLALILSAVHDFVLGPRAGAPGADPSARVRASWVARINVLVALAIVAFGLSLFR